MEVRRELLTMELLEELEPLFKELYEEAGDKSFELDFNKLLYIRCSNAGVYVGYTAREDTGKVMGYVGYWLGTHPHYSVSFAQADVLYVDKKFRGTYTALKLLREAERDLKEYCEVEWILHGSSTTDTSPLLLRRGYKELGKTFSKEI